MPAFLLVYSLMIVGAAGLGRVAGAPSLFTLPPTGRALALSLLAATLAALAVVEAGRRLEARPWYRDMGLTLRRALERLLGPDFDQFALTVAAYSAVAEEALFRGVLQPWLVERAGRALAAPGTLAATALGVTAASAAFGLVHWSRGVKELRPWTAFAFAVGLLFGALAAASGSLAAPVLAHLLINYLNIRRLKGFPRAEAGPDGVAPRGPLM